MDEQDGQDDGDFDLFIRCILFILFIHVLLQAVLTSFWRERTSRGGVRR